MAQGREAGVEPWQQQPTETAWEYTVWTAFRDSYPGKMPKYGEVAQQLNTTYSVVHRIAQRWSFQVRMQMWIKECERVTLEQRRREVLDMNKDHVSMARTLREKMKLVIDNLDPALVKPSELGSLMRIATDLERKANLDTIEQTHLQAQDALGPGAAGAAQDNKAVPKQADLGEIVGILLKAGALGSITQIGVKQTTEVTLGTDDKTVNVTDSDE